MNATTLDIPNKTQAAPYDAAKWNARDADAHRNAINDHAGQLDSHTEQLSQLSDTVGEAVTHANNAVDAATTAAAAAQEASAAAQAASVGAQAPTQIRLLDHINPAAPDHTAGFNEAVQAAKDAGFSVIQWRGYNGQIKLTDSITGLVTTGGELHIGMDGDANAGIVYAGSSNKLIFPIVGNRFTQFNNVNVEIARGRQDVYIWDLDTSAVAASTTHMKWTNCNCLLGDGLNNTAHRRGHTSAANAQGAGRDISNVYVEGGLIYGYDGGTQSTYDGAKYAVPGQRAIAEEGPNVLTNGTSKLLIAYVDKGYTTTSEAYKRDGSGNLTLMSAAEYGGMLNNGQFVNGAGGHVLDGIVFSHCKVDMKYSSIQSLKGSGLRSENSFMHFYLTPSSDGGVISFDNIQIDECLAQNDFGFVNGAVYALLRASKANIKGLRVSAYKKPDAQGNLVATLHGPKMFLGDYINGTPGSISLEHSFLAASDPFATFSKNTAGGDRVAGDTACGKLYLRDVQQIGTDNSLGAYYADRNG